MLRYESRSHAVELCARVPCFQQNLSLAGLLFTLDMFLRFRTGVVIIEQSTATLLMDGRAVAQHYIWKGSFLVDFFATIPSWVEVCHDEFK